MNTLEEVNINVKLLTEMLSHYNKDSSTDSDKDIIKVCAREHVQLSVICKDKCVVVVTSCVSALRSSTRGVTS